MQSPSAVPYITVQIGPAAGHILEVTPVGIRYLDEARREHVLDLTDYEGKEMPIIGRRVLDGGWSHPEEPPYYVIIYGRTYVCGSLLQRMKQPMPSCLTYCMSAAIGH